MHPRRIAKLASLPVPKLLASLAEGTSLVAEHVATLDEDAIECSARGRAAVRAIADEEAGKFLILMDVARCAHRPQRIRSEQLKRASNHLAKGIYAEVTWMSPATYG